MWYGLCWLRSDWRASTIDDGLWCYDTLSLSQFPSSIDCFHGSCHSVACGHALAEHMKSLQMLRTISSDPGGPSARFSSDKSWTGYFVESDGRPDPMHRSGRSQIYVWDLSGLGCARGCSADLCCSGLRGTSHGKRTSVLLSHLNDHYLSSACAPGIWP